MKKLRIEVKQRVRTGGDTIGALRFADNIVFCAKTEDMICETFPNKILCYRYSIWLNKNKTKVIACSKTNPIHLDMKIDNAWCLEQIQYFNCLGSKITDDGRSKADTVSRLAQEGSSE